MKRVLSLIALTLLVWFSLPLNAYAAEKGITISPFLQEVNIKASELTKNFSVDVTNHTDKPLTLTVKTVDFGSLDESGGVAFSGLSGQALNAKYGLAAWLSLDKTTLTLAPNQTEKVTATIQNSSTLGPGGHYAAILLTANGTANGGQVAINQTLSSLVFLTKTGGEIYRLELQTVKLSNTWLKLPLTTVLPIKNTGNVHVTPRGVITLIDPFGKTVRQGIINQESGIVLPEAKRNYAVDLRQLNKFSWPGRYRLRIQYRYSSNAKFVTEELTFWYVGWPLLFLLVVLGILIALIRTKKIQLDRPRKFIKKIAKKLPAKPVHK
jgi:hypothetical protein